MNLSEIFIRRPIATSLLMAAIALFGVVAYRWNELVIAAGAGGYEPEARSSGVRIDWQRPMTSVRG